MIKDAKKMCAMSIDTSLSSMLFSNLSTYTSVVNEDYSVVNSLNFLKPEGYHDSTFFKKNLTLLDHRATVLSSVKVGSWLALRGGGSGGLTRIFTDIATDKDKKKAKTSIRLPDMGSYEPHDFWSLNGAYKRKLDSYNVFTEMYSFSRNGNVLGLAPFRTRSRFYETYFGSLQLTDRKNILNSTKNNI